MRAWNDQAFTKIKGKLDWITVDVTELLVPHRKRQSKQPRALGNRNAPRMQISQLTCIFRKNMGENSPS